MLKFEYIIKKPIMVNHAFFLLLLILVGSISSLISILPFVCLQCYKHNCLNIPTCSICFRIQVKIHQK